MHEDNHSHTMTITDPIHYAFLIFKMITCDTKEESEIPTVPSTTSPPTWKRRLTRTEPPERAVCVLTNAVGIVERALRNVVAQNILETSCHCVTSPQQGRGRDQRDRVHVVPVQNPCSRLPLVYHRGGGADQRDEVRQHDPGGVVLAEQLDLLCNHASGGTLSCG